MQKKIRLDDKILGKWTKHVEQMWKQFSQRKDFNTELYIVLVGS